jgi:hypothetical protein
MTLVSGCGGRTMYKHGVPGLVGFAEKTAAMAELLFNRQ